MRCTWPNSPPLFISFLSIAVAIQLRFFITAASLVFSDHG